jgi:hypothetical protein
MRPKANENKAENVVAKPVNQNQSVEQMTSEQLCLIQGQQYNQIIQSQAQIMQAQQNIVAITKEIEKRQQSKGI